MKKNKSIREIYMSHSIMTGDNLIQQEFVEAIRENNTLRFIEIKYIGLYHKIMDELRFIGRQKGIDIVL
jgi:hypothetical protein